jgi:ABC-type iron transport system FetAB ATPase subunit
MPVIKAAHIRRFKSILDQRIEFGRLNVFIGANGAGKSNLLEALGVIAAAASGTIDWQRIKERGVRLSQPGLYRSNFKEVPRTPDFDLEVAFDGLRYAASLGCERMPNKENPWFFRSEQVALASQSVINARNGETTTIPGMEKFSSNPLRPDHSLLARLEALGRLNPNETKCLDCLRTYAIYAPATPILRGLVPDDSRTGTLGLYGGGFEETSIPVLWNAINYRDNPTAPPDEDWRNSAFIVDRFLKNTALLSGIGIMIDISKHEDELKERLSFNDKHFHQKLAAGELTISDVNEGVLYTLFVVLLLCHPATPRILALDNVDHYLNPSAATRLMALITAILIRNDDRQVFFTTHSPTALDALDLFDDDQRLFVVERGAQGGTEIRRIQPPAGTTREQWEERYGHMNLSEVWLSGAIGGLTPPQGF